MKSDNNVLWIARDDDGSLWLFDEKPVKVRGMWRNGALQERMSAMETRIQGCLFPTLTVDNSPKMLGLKG